MFDYKIYTSGKGERRVKFANGEDHFVEKTYEGKECFAVPNPYAKDDLKLFVNRIGDAIQAVQEDYGDEIRISSLFGGSESVLRYVDREYGEEARKNCIQHYQNAHFLWGIKLGNKNSFESSFLLEDDSIQSPLDAYSGNKLLFKREEEALGYIASLNEQVRELLNRYKRSENRLEFYRNEIAPLIRNFNAVGVSAWWSRVEPTHIFKTVQLIYW